MIKWIHDPDKEAYKVMFISMSLSENYDMYVSIYGADKIKLNTRSGSLTFFCTNL
jgi:hypothetical protein